MAFPRHSAFRRRGGEGGLHREGAWPGSGKARALVYRGSHRFHARQGRARAAGKWGESSEARRAVQRYGSCCRRFGPHPLQPPPQSAARRPACHRTVGARSSLLLQRCAQWPRARTPRAAAATAVPAAAAAAAPGPAEVRGDPGRGWGRGWGRRRARRASLSASHRASPASSASFLLLARGGGRAGWAWRAGRRGSGAQRAAHLQAQPR